MGKSTFARLLITLVAFIAVVPAVYSANKVFTGPGNFSDPTRWNGNSLPTANDNLRIRGVCTFDNSASNLQYGTLTVGQGIQAGTLQWPAGGTNTLRVTSINAGVSGSSINMTNGGTLQLSGTWNSALLSFISGTGTVVVAGSTTLPAAYSTYNNVVVQGMGTTLTLGAATTLTGNLTTGVFTTLNTAGLALTVNGTTTIGFIGTVNAGASAITCKGNFVNQGFFNAGTSTITFNGTSAQNVSGSFGNAFNNVITGNPAGVSFVSNTAVNGTLAASGITNIGGINFSVTGPTTVSGTLNFTSATGNKTLGDITINSGGNWNVSAAEAFTVSGSIQNNGTLTANTGIYTLSGTGMTISGTNAVPIPNATITGSYTNNGTFTVSTALSGGGSLTQGTGSTLNIGGTSAITTLNAVANIPNTVNYNGSVAQSIKCTPYHHLGIAGSGTKTLLCAATVNGDLLISGGTLSVSASNFNINLSGNWTNTGGTFSHGTGTVFLVGAATQTITNASGENFYDLVVSGAGALLGGAITVNNNLTINSALNVSASSYTINLKRNWINNGIFTAQQGTVVLNGTIAQTIGGTAVTTFRNITLNNSAGASLANSQDLTGTLTISAGIFTTTGQTFTLISNAAGTARIAAIPSGADLNGNITMQRYITGATDWRMLGSPVAGQNLSNWQDDFAMSGFTGSTAPTMPFVSVYTYDETQAGDKDIGWVPASNISNAVPPGKGFFVYMGPNPVTVDVTGTPNKFGQTFTLTYTPNAGALNDGWNLVANPYPSSIDWNAAGWTKTNMNNAVYVWNPSAQQFASYVSGFGTNGGSNIIPSSQAFWVQANAASPAISFTENVKSATDQGFFRSALVQQGEYAFKLRIAGASYSDETVIRFDPAATASFDPAVDAQKFYSMNTYVPSIATVPDTIDYSINSLPALTANVSIPVRVKVGISGSYTISDSLLGMPLSACLMLEDRLTGIFTDLRTSDYTFSISDTTNYPRFIIHVGQPIEKAAIPVLCSSSSEGIAIATGNGTGPWNYLWTNVQGDTLQYHANTSNADSLINVPAGIYTVTVTGNSGQCATLLDTVEITSPAPVTFSASVTDETCNGNADGAVVMNAVNGGTPPFTYQWSNGLTSANIGGLAPGTYSLVITDNNGCTAAGTVVINAGLQLIAGFTANADTLYLVNGGQVMFSNTSSGAASYEWDFGDGSLTDTVAAPSHNYVSAGTYTVTLIASNGSCTDTSYSVLTVLSDYQGIADEGSSFDAQLLYGPGEVYIAFTGSAEDVNISIYNSLGQQISDTYFARVSDETKQLVIPTLPGTGVYFVRIISGKQQIVRRFVYGN